MCVCPCVPESASTFTVLHLRLVYRCSFLDSITEELEESSLAGGPEGEASVYEDYKFVTRDELARLGLTHLIGSPVLKVRDPSQRRTCVDALGREGCMIAAPFVFHLCCVACACCAHGLLQAFMHGFWLEMKLYNKILAVADPFAFERYRKERYVLPTRTSAILLTFAVAGSCSSSSVTACSRTFPLSVSLCFNLFSLYMYPYL
jgi:hypothetical protein